MFYDGKRDAQAQATVTAARELASGSLFETQLRNLEELGQQQLETVLRWQEIRMRAALNSFKTWDDVVRVLDRVEKELAPFLDTETERAYAEQRGAEIRDRAARLRTLISRTRDKIPNRSAAADEIFARLGSMDETVEFANGLAGKLQINPATVTALNQVLASLDQVLGLYTSVQDIMIATAAVSVPVSSLRPDPLETELTMLAAEEEHWRTLGLIRARQALEVGEIKGILERARVYASGYPGGEKIEDTLASLGNDRERLEFALYAVHYAAAVAAQQETSAQLASLRKSLELRRYSIQRSAVSASTYEQTTRAAAERLALYWRSGIKPKDLAELVFHLATAASLPVIAAR